MVDGGTLERASEWMDLNLMTLGKKKGYSWIFLINIGTLRDKTKEIIELMKKIKIRIVDLVETRWRSEDRKVLLEVETR